MSGKAVSEMSDTARNGALSKSTSRWRWMFRCGLLVAILTCLFFLAFHARTLNLTKGGTLFPLRTKAKLIAHAGSGLATAARSNSRQALDSAYAHGFTEVEMDFSETCDEKLVATHDWNQFFAALHEETALGSLMRRLTGNRESHADFMREPMRGGLAAVDVAWLRQWLRKHPRMRIVTDMKDDNLRGLRQLLDAGIPTSRLIPQIYHQQQLDPVRALGFVDIYYTLYRDRDVPIPDAAVFARRNRLSVILFKGRATAQAMRIFTNAGVPVYVHTVNDIGRARSLLRQGVSGIYTDFIFPTSGRS